MTTALKGIYEVNACRYKPKDSELAFVYNILAPDLLLFICGISFAFGFLLYIF